MGGKFPNVVDQALRPFLIRLIHLTKNYRTKAYLSLLYWIVSYCIELYYPTVSISSVISKICKNTLRQQITLFISSIIFSRNSSVDRFLFSTLFPSTIGKSFFKSNFRQIFLWFLTHHVFAITVNLHAHGFKNSLQPIKLKHQGTKFNDSYSLCE